MRARLKGGLATGRARPEIRNLFKKKGSTELTDSLNHGITLGYSNQEAASRLCRRMVWKKPRRVSELSSQRRDFPWPGAKLAAGPVWLESALRRFVENWSRKPTSIGAESLSGRTRCASAGHRLHQLLVKQADSVAALVVFVPGLIIVPCSFTESAENAFEVILVVESDMLLNRCDTSEREPSHCVFRFSSTGKGRTKALAGATMLPGSIGRCMRKIAAIKAILLSLQIPP